MSLTGTMTGTRVMLAGAQTGGHLYPAVAVGRRLRELGAEVVLVSSGSQVESAILKDCPFKVETLKVRKLKGMNLKGKLAGLASLPGALLRALWLTKGIGPHVAVGFGGYTTGPLLLAAALLGVPVVVCEQNSIPGFTNRLLARIARRVLVAFEETVPLIGPKAVLTGNPVRPEILAVPPRRYDRPSRHVLVVGGSQGSAFLNRHVPPLLAQVAQRVKDLSVTHQTGVGRDATVRAEYESKGIKADVREYLQDMAAAYAAADLVICRAGAGTIFEVTAVGIPALFVPFALATDDHQTANARAVVAAGGGLCVPEQEFEVPRVASMLTDLLLDQGRLEAMAQASRAWCRRDALDQIVEEVVSLCVPNKG